MTNPHGPALPQILTDGTDVTAHADVLVIGGGPAGCWAAIAAADGGLASSSSTRATAGTSRRDRASGVGVWYVPPQADAREAAMASREQMGGYLADRDWMDRVLDETYAQRRAAWPTGATPSRSRTTAASRGRACRAPSTCVACAAGSRAGVKILDHSPALELLRRRRRSGRRRRRACAARRAARGPSAPASTSSPPAAARSSAAALGCDVLTGDGHLLAAEAGARAVRHGVLERLRDLRRRSRSVTKTAFYHWATFLLRGRPGDRRRGSASRARSIARTLHERARSTRSSTAPTTELRPQLRARAAELLPAVRPRGHRPVHRALRGHAAPRRHGARHRRPADRRRALRDVGARAVRGGRRATRELICGGFTGGGSHNAAWAISSGTWAGRGAAAHARRSRATDAPVPVGGVGLRPASTATDDLDLAGARARRPGRGAPVRQELLPHRRRAATPRAPGSTACGAQARAHAPARRRRTSCAPAKRRRCSRHARWMYASGAHRTRDARDAQAPRPSAPRTRRSTTGCWSAGWTSSRSRSIRRGRRRRPTRSRHDRGRQRVALHRLRRLRRASARPTSSSADPTGCPSSPARTTARPASCARPVCPEDALFVAPLVEPATPGSFLRDEEELIRRDLLGSYRRQLGWGDGQEPTAARDTTTTVLAAFHGPQPPRLREHGG